LAKLELTTAEEKYSKIKAPVLSRPNNKKTPNSTIEGIRIVKAISGDTVAKIAQRNGVNPVDVANLNGFTSINAALSAGREIKIPTGMQYRISAITKESKTSPTSTGVCNLPLAESPALRGVKFGMSIAVVSKILGVRLETGRTESLASISNLKNRDGKPWDTTDPTFVRLVNEKGVESYSTKKKEYITVKVPGYILFSMTGTGKKALDGVVVISLYFFENRLYLTNYIYDTDAFKNMSDKEFITSIASTLNLPEKYWDKYGSASCKNFDVRAFRYESKLSIEVKSKIVEGLIEKQKEIEVIKMYDELKKKVAVELKKRLEEKGFRP
jgi:LysM repeat protein